MISLGFRGTLSVALICFILGCCTAFLVIAKCGSDVKQPAVTQAKLLKVQADSLHTHYQTMIVSLENRNQQLAAELTATKAELKAAKVSTKAKATAIKKMITLPGYPAKNLLQKAGKPATAIDSSLEKCDSLVNLIAAYIEESEVKDSLFEAQALQQDSLIAGKDAVIALQGSENRNLSFLFKQSLDEQQNLMKSYSRLQKKMKRQRAVGRWLAIGTAVLSGLATHYFTNR